MLPGFLPFSRASLVLDFVAVAMALVVPLLAYSITLVKREKRYELHKKLQLGIAAVLAVAVTIFEIDMRINGWRQYATPSPYYETLVFPVLAMHIAISTTTVILWAMVIWQALRNFPVPPGPTVFSPKHKKLARRAAIGMYLTSVSGWVFFYLAFIA